MKKKAVSRSKYLHRLLLFLCLSACSGTLTQEPVGLPQQAFELFAQNCFNPYLTANRLQEQIKRPDIRYDFYDLSPFSRDNAPSLPKGRPISPKTDRRCEISFTGSKAERAAEVAIKALKEEGILEGAALPVQYAKTRLPGASLLAARRLNPDRIAVVHTGVRAHKDGMETFLLVERLVPGEGI